MCTDKECQFVSVGTKPPILRPTALRELLRGTQENGLGGSAHPFVGG